MHNPYLDPVQDAWPERTCHGCGPANEDGIQLKSYLADDRESLVASVDLDDTYGSGVENVLNGGVIATLVDCHAIWTATTFAYEAEDRALLEEPPIYFVTGELDVTYRAPTPVDAPVHLEAWVEEFSDDMDSAAVRCRGGPAGETTFEGSVVAVRRDDWIEQAVHF